MRIMLFYDLRNFEGSLKECKRFLHISSVQNFLVKKLNSLLNLKLEPKDVVRAYAYTGEYTESFIKHVKDSLAHESDPTKQTKIKSYLEYVERQKKKNEIFKQASWKYNFFELKTLPLKYSWKLIDSYQKGVDVELAVDLVSYAYKDAYDIAIVCSGDIDLQRSMERVKGLGKQVVLVSHPNCMSDELMKCADYFIDISRLSDAELDEISHVFVPHK